MEQMEKLKEYIQQLQSEAYEKGFRVANDREKKKGHWIENIEYDNVIYICSVCKEPWVLIEGTPKDNKMNYCPTCGAKMED